MNGKGDATRPMNVTQEEYARRWALAFGSVEEYEAALREADAHWEVIRELEQATRRGMLP
jgi:hypothetical protein